MDPLQIAGSLIAIVALASLAKWLGLGRQPVLANEAEARAAANEAIDGFSPAKIALDQAGHGALLQDSHGQILILKPHGNFFAGRVLTHAACASSKAGALVVDCGESRFGSVTLTLDDAPYWAAAIDGLKQAHNA